MNGVSVVVLTSCFVGDFTVSCFLGEFSLDSFLLNSFVGEKFLSLVRIYCPKVSSGFARSTL